MFGRDDAHSGKRRRNRRRPARLRELAGAVRKRLSGNEASREANWRSIRNNQQPRFRRIVLCRRAFGYGGECGRIQVRARVIKIEQTPSDSHGQYDQVLIRRSADIRTGSGWSPAPQPLEQPEPFFVSGLATPMPLRVFYAGHRRELPPASERGSYLLPGHREPPLIE